MLLLLLNLILIFIIMMLFFFFSKFSKWSIYDSSGFECGFSSYFFSRNSFSMHYYLIGLIFLFLDLELCFVMPFFNQEFYSFLNFLLFSIFIFILILGLIFEWVEKKLEWKF